MNTQQNNAPENVVKAMQAIETILKECKVALIPVIVHQGDVTYSSVDVVSIEETPSTELQ